MISERVQSARILAQNFINNRTRNISAGAQRCNELTFLRWILMPIVGAYNHVVLARVPYDIADVFVRLTRNEEPAIAEPCSFAHRISLMDSSIHLKGGTTTQRMRFCVF
jgi:hypothetical protein